MLNILLLTTAIGIGASRSPASESKDAYKAIAKATYIKSGYDKKVKQLEKKVIPKDVREYGGWITGLTKVAIEKKISVEWTF